MSEMEKRLKEAERLIRTMPMAAYIKFGMSEPGTRAYILAEKRIEEYESERSRFIAESRR